VRTTKHRGFFPAQRAANSDCRQGIRGESGTEKKIKNKGRVFFSILPILILEFRAGNPRPSVEGLKTKGAKN
jgi:hypothetical protein